MMPPLTPDSPEALHRQRWRLAVIAGATIIGLAESSKAYVSYRLTGHPVDVGFVLIENMPWWYLWAALIPVVIWLVRRFPLEGPARWRSVVVHLPASVAVASVHLFLFSLIHYPAIARGGLDASFEAQEARFYNSFLFNEILTFWTIVLGYYVFVNYRRYRESALETARAEARAARLEIGRIEASLNALRMELNPHFLFNTLNSIAGLVRQSKTTEAVEMLARLGELLRISLDQGDDQTVSLGAELRFLQIYLALEQIRYQDRLTIEFHVSEDCLETQVPTLILQPLVENAIHHGFASMPGPGTITIEAHHEGDELILEVADTGKGISPLIGGTMREGVGLSNTRARLRVLYRHRGHLELANRPGGGARVRVILPREPSVELRGAVASV